MLSGGAFIALFAGIALTTQVLTRPFLGRALFLELHRILALAWMATWLLAFFLPTATSVMAFEYGYWTPQTILALVSTYQVVLSVGFGFLLHRNLQLRTFVRAETI